MAENRDEGVLRISAMVFAIAALVHNGDHLRRGGDSVATDVFALGTIGMALEVTVVALVLMGHRLGSLAAASLGGSLAAGYVAVHLSPQRTWLSDSLTAGADITWFSWVAVIALVVASIVLAVAGSCVFRRRGGLAGALRPTQPPGTVLHPVTAALAVGNLVILAGSVATL